MCIKFPVFTPLNKNSILYFNHLLWRQNCQVSMSLGSEVKLLGFISCLHLLLSYLGLLNHGLLSVK